MLIAHPLKIMIFIFVALMGWIGWSMTNTYVTSSKTILDVVIPQINELHTGKTDQTPAMMDNKLQELDDVRPSAVAADAAFQGITGIKGETPKILDGAREIVEARKQELLVKENTTNRN